MDYFDDFIVKWGEKMPHLAQKLCPRLVLALLASLLLILAGGLPATAVDNASISGKVTVPAGTNAEDTWVTVWTTNPGGFNEWAGGAGVNGDGSYSVSSLPAGSFKVQFSNPSTLDHWHSNASSFDAATPIDVAAGQALTGINATLVKDATISGTVTAPVGVDLSTVFATALTADGSWAGNGSVAADGSYKISGLTAGSYKVSFSGWNSGALEHWYNNATTFETATLVTLAAGQDLTGINAALVKGASISGTVTAPAGVELTSVSVYARPSNGSSWETAGSADVAPDGTYKITGLPAGSFKLEFVSSGSGALEQWYNNKSSFETATPVTLAAGQDLTGINAALVKGATISGKITGPAGVSLDAVAVSARTASGNSWAGSADVAVDGTYKIVGLPAGSYKLEFDGYGSGALTQWYNNGSSFETATPVTLTTGQDLAGINATLVKAATISGKVTVPAGVDLSQVFVYARTLDGTFAGSAELFWGAPDGTYKISGLPAGSFKIEFGGWNSGALNQWYNNANSFEAAAPVTLSTGQDLTGINATLAKGATVSGKVTAPAGTSLDASAVNIFKSDAPNEPVFSASVATDGTYKAIGIPTGSYKVQFDGGASGAMDQWFGGSSFATASAVSLTAGSDRTGIDFSVQTGGAISGKITGAGSYYPVSVLDATGAVVRSSRANNDGTYSIKGLTSGTYKVAFNRSSGFTTEEAQFYLNKPESAGPAQATGVPVQLGQTTPNIGATLGTGAKISGTVLDKAGNPLPNVMVQAYTSDGSLVTRSTNTDSLGKYTISGTTTGKYIVRVLPFGSTLADLYSGNVTSEANASLVASTSGSTTTLNLSYAAVAELTAPVPTITGTAKVGVTLTANPGTWGPAPVALAYQWKAGGVAITGATAATYKAAPADLGKTITVTVTGTKTGYTTTAKTSAATAAVLAGTLTSAVPTITGTPAVGQTLTANPGTWGPAPVTLYYQWKANGVSITGATLSTYKPVAADVGKTITVTVTGRKTGYTAAAKTSTATVAVKATAPALTAPVPTITGTAKVGVTLTANPGTWGPAPVTLAYQWKAGGTAISGATASTYKPASTTLGKTITVTVTGTKTGYTTTAKTSAATAAVVAGTLTTAVPTITGTPAVGQILTANPGTWGPAPVTLYYQWKANGVSITGATTSTYKPVAADVGKTITVTVTGRKTGYTAAAKTSAATTAVKATAPALTAPVPTITGTAKVGVTLTANPGTWGPAPVTLAYQWKAGGVAITGATAATYKAAPADLGKTITVTVTGTKAGYATTAKTSAATAAVVAGTLTAAVPTITGTAAVGQTLTANPGTWGPAPVTLYYQWKANGVSVTGATASTYKPVAADVGKTITVTVTGRKIGYTAAARTSAATAAVK